ncbi:hypothetical protein [Streptomyces sp. NPDC001809]
MDRPEGGLGRGRAVQSPQVTAKLRRPREPAAGAEDTIPEPRYQRAYVFHGIITVASIRLWLRP